MNLLNQARLYEDKLRDTLVSQRPVFHLTGPVGWINDPNGFSIYKGEYHLFFQYYPFSLEWGTMHWGHAKTKDFLHWEYLPVALAPDKEYDKNGCFSGSAIELDDGSQMLFYTGVTPVNYNTDVSESQTETDSSSEPPLYQNQCIAIGDGVNYTKIETNPVLLASSAPKGGSLIDFREPKIWKENDTYYTLLSYRPADGSGDILLYESKDAFHWNFVSVFASNGNRYGKMWECPDFFLLDEQNVLLVSPMEMQAKGLEFHAGHGTMALLGDYDRSTHTFSEQYIQAIDYGIEFYSTQTVQTPDGRRIMIAWMQNWATKDMRNKDLQFFGQMTVPRELHIKNNRLIQNPVREIENYRINPVSYQNVPVFRQPSGTGQTLDNVHGRILDMVITLTPAPDQDYHLFEIQLAQNDQYEFLIQYYPSDNRIHVDRNHCGSHVDVVHQRDFYVKDCNGEIKLRILMDKYSVELFVNDGEQAATFLCYTPEDADGIRFRSDGTVYMNIEKYDLQI